MTEIRIPTEFIKKITKDLKTDPNIKTWRFESYGGNIITARLQSGAYSITKNLDGNLVEEGPPWEAIDFTLNEDLD